jgi:hypothetical protein
VDDIRRALLLPTVGLIIVQALHDLDHVRQDRSIEAPVLFLGGVAYIAALAVLLLVLRRRRVAPAAAIVIGFGTAVGFVAVHVVPDWGPLADGYPEAGVDAGSWAVVLLDIAVALWLGVVGLRARRAASPSIS